MSDKVKKMISIVTDIIILGVIVFIVLGFVLNQNKDGEVKFNNPINPKYKVKIVVNFTENLIMDKYNVNMYLGKNEELLNHGQNGEFEYELEKGEYVIKFQSTTNTNVYNEVKLNVKGETEVSYKINTHKSTIDIKQLYIKNYADVKEDDVMIDFSSTDLSGQNYKTVVQALKNTGFNNVQTEPVYDIVFGVTPEYSVSSVYIGQSNTFTKGNIFNKDTKVTVIYHMSQSSNTTTKIKN